MLIQLPVFFILYQVLLGLTRRGPYGADVGSSVTCHVGGLGTMCSNGIVPTAGYFDPKYISHTSKLYIDLSNTRAMMSWGIDLSQSVLKSLHQGVGHAAPYVILVILVVASTYFQQVQIQRRTPASAVNPTQQLTMKIMPVAMGVIYLLIPAGVVVYFLVSNIFRIGQQALVTRTVYGPEGAIPTTARATDDEPAAKKSFRDNFIPGESSLPRVGKRARSTSTEIETTATRDQRREGGRVQDLDRHQGGRREQGRGRRHQESCAEQRKGHDRWHLERPALEGHAASAEGGPRQRLRHAERAEPQEPRAAAEPFQEEELEPPTGRDPARGVGRDNRKDH